jgi:hypothetical protein
MNAFVLMMLLSFDGGTPMTAFAAPREAFSRVLATRPQILGVGEYHELAGAPKVPSALRHFTAEALPVLDGGATSMIVETWMLSGRCGEVEKQLAAAVEQTTKRPVETEDEVATMMGRAFDLGLKNHTLIITCADYASMLDSNKELDAEKSLLLMRGRVLEKAIEVRENDEGGLPGKMLIIYGGAIHNDLEPTSDDAVYSFGPRLRRETNGGYTELDLLVPEYVEGDHDLLKHAWFRPALALAKKGKTVLVQPSSGVNVIVFAYSKAKSRRR